MNKRTFKMVALILSGGVLLQLSACASVLLQNFASYFASTALSQLVSGVIDQMTGGTTTP